MTTSQVLTKAKVLTSKGDFEQAEHLIVSVLSKYPNNKSAQQHLIRLSQKRADKYGPAIQLQTQRLLELAHTFENGDYKTSIELCNNLKLLYPEKFIIWFMDGVAKRHLSAFNEAFQSFEMALKINPKHAELHFEIGRALEESGDNKNAYKSYHRSKILDPEDARPENALGLMYQKAQKYEKAFDLFVKATEADPRSADSFNNAALACNEMLDFEESSRFVAKAIELEPTVPQFHLNAAFIQSLKGNIQNALTMHEDAIERAKAASMSHLVDEFSFNEALIRLANGQIERGWAAYKKRFESLNFPSKKRKFDKPHLKNITEARNKKILLWKEQGLGDEFMFLNLAKYFQNITNCKFIIEGSFRLKSLMQRSFPDDEVLDVGYDAKNDSFFTHANDFDFHMPYGDFPILLNLKENSLDMITPYLKADKELVKKWNNELPSGKLRVGFSWRSQLKHGIRKIGYTELDQWEKLISSEHYSFINLQYGDVAEDINNTSETIRDNLFQPKIDLKNDLENVAAIIENCDVVIAPGNAVLHQAAAQGKKTITYVRPDGSYFLGRKQKLNQASRHPFLYDNYAVCYDPIDKALIPKLVEKELFNITTS